MGSIEAEVVPVLSLLTVPELVTLTGLSRHYCWQVRAGKKRLHPMHWGRSAWRCVGSRPFGQRLHLIAVSEYPFGTVDRHERS